ncbi:hypothetical protein PCANC_26449 [Puccinia coronata f. sp. avenae]|uniref:NF-X1-type domain-containing protein n=1 Tax=Puccinia coronata f. sp. avenae TaxID=200324 RepID=A0A2N5TRB2_9BASI|nr:hypothetical protein PCANC_26449 [Puccinia coronata f. sp. avenae]
MAASQPTETHEPPTEATAQQQQQQLITRTTGPANRNTNRIRNTRNNMRNRNNCRNRNNTHDTQQSTSSNPLNRSQPQQPIHSNNQRTHRNHQNHQQGLHQSKEHGQRRLNLNDRQPPPHLEPSTEPSSSLAQVQQNHDRTIQPTSPKPIRNNRRKAFGSKLTDQERGISNQSSKPSTPANPVDLSSLSLSARLILEISSSSYDCSICISPIGPHHAIYHCPNCYTILHLNCATKWASRSIADTSAKALLLRDRDRIPCSEEALQGEWRCPGCQLRHIGQMSIPKNYSCWCGKVENPSTRNKQHAHPPSKIPHSCAKRCGKIQAKGCTHGCMEECHPGSCPPCSAVIKTKCHCGKTDLSIRCSQLYTNRAHLEPANSEILSCGEVCNHDLQCGLHACKRVCHPEECETCPVIRQKSCYCGHLLLADQKCSDHVAQHPLAHSSPEKFTCVSQDGSEWLGEFACKDLCAWKYDCGIHSCESTCHPHLVSTPPPCPFSPALLTTCPCGATPMNNRQSCSDPISTCANICRKVMASCGHECGKICHLGPCGPCKSLVTTICNCGKDKIVRRCIELEELKESALVENGLKSPSERQATETVKTEAVQYRCERPCRVLRHCGKHTCHRRCCPLSFLENVLHTGSKQKKSQAARLHEDEDPLGLHVCDLKCNKKLSCGLHTCQLQDHRGPCPTCLQASFDELFCPCGATVIQPPVPCGTKIDCPAPCQRPSPVCGHPKLPHTCHEEPECPPCPYLTEKACQCDKKKLVKNVRCSQPKVSCGTICENLLACGAHRCSRQCHPSGQCEDCDRDCLKPRKHCGHGCQQKCHAPSSCRTDEPCEAAIDIQCACGRITQKMQCASCDARPSGNRERGLKCNDDCILFQRNTALAAALQITKPSSAEGQSGVSIDWSSRLLNFFGTHALFAKAIEKQLVEFVKAPLSLKPSSSKNSLIIHTFSKLKQAFLLELVTYYRIKPETLGEEPRFTVKLVKDSSSSLPTTLLSHAHANHLDANKPYANEDKQSPFPALGTTLFRIPDGSMAAASTPKLEAHGSKDPSLGNLSLDAMVTSGPHQNLSIIFKGVFGHDQQSLAGLIESINNQSRETSQIKFRLNWINDEDVLLRLSLSSTGTQTEFHQLRLIYESLVSFFQSQSEDWTDSHSWKKFYKTIELVRVHLLADESGANGEEEENLRIQEIERIGRPAVNKAQQSGWKSSAKKKPSSALFSQSSQPQSNHTSNRFSSLASSAVQGNPRAWGTGAFGDVISGGFNRPPIAVLAPVASTSHSRNSRSTAQEKFREEEEVVDDWETAL